MRKMIKGYRVNLFTMETELVISYEQSPDTEPYVYCAFPQMTQDEVIEDYDLEKYQDSYHKNGKEIFVDKVRLVLNPVRKTARLVKEAEKAAKKEKIKNKDIDDKLNLKEALEVIKDMRDDLYG